MQVPFRQGLVHTPATFLQLATGKVNLLVPSTDTVVINFADGDANYLVTVGAPVTGAWGGPFVTGLDYWLYFDLDTLTGELTYGFTTLLPVVGPAAPSTPMVNQHWFDTVAMNMKVWNGAGWVRKIRVFAAKLNQGVQFISMSASSSSTFVGTQIGSSTSVASGALVFDDNGNVFKHSDGTFFTTEDAVFTGIANSAQVKFGSMVVQATAQTNLAAYQIVRFTSFNTVSAATNYLIDNGAYGIILTDALSGQPAQITMEGVITNPNWDWSAYPVNTMLYTDTTGALTVVAPPTPIPVATIINAQTILMRPSSLFANHSNDPATVVTPGAVQVTVAPVDPQHPIAVGDNDPRITAVIPHITDTTVHLSPAQNTYLDALIGSGVGFSVVKGDGTGTTVTLVPPSSGISITSPDGNTGNPTFALVDDLASLEGLTTTGVSVRTGSSTWTTRQFVVDSTSTASLTITNGDGVAGNPTLAITGELSGIQGLSALGIATHTATGTWGTVELTSLNAPGLTIINGNGVAGNPTFSFTSDLAAVTGLTTYGLSARTADGVWTTRSITTTDPNISITNGDGIGGDVVLSLTGEVGAVGAVATTGLAVRAGATTWVTTSVIGSAGNIVVTNGSGFTGSTPANIIVDLATVGTPVTSSFVKLTTDTRGRVSATTAVTAADIESSLGYVPVNKAGDSMSGALDMGTTNKIVNMADPTNAADAATKNYVDNVAQGLDPKNSVRATNATTDGNQTLNGPATIDGVVLATGDRVLLRNQTDATTNGIYVANTSGAWTLALDSEPEISLTSGAYVFVEEGTTNAASGWVLTTANPISGKALTFSQFSGAGQIIPGVGIAKNGNTLSVVSGPNATMSVTTNGIDMATLPSSAGTWHQVQVDTYGRVVAGVNPTTLSQYNIVDAQPLNANLTSVAAVSTTGILVESAANTVTTRQVVGAQNQITVTNGSGVAGNPTVALSVDPIVPGNGSITVPTGTTAQEPGGAADGAMRYNTTTSTMRIHESGAWKNMGTLRNVGIVAPAAGISVTPTTPSTDTATFTLALTSELLGVQTMNTFGMVARTNTGTWTTRTLQGTAGNIVVTNADGIAADPVINLAANGIVASTYRSVTVDIYGRVSAGTNPTTLGGYGITDAQPLNANLSALSAYNTTGFITQTGTNTFSGRSFAVAANSSANLAITNPDGVSGSPSFAFTGDILAISQLSATGFATRTGAGAWAQRQITGAANRVNITNGTGVNGDVIVDVSATYAGQGSITTVGTIASGTWNGTAIGAAYGGTGLSTIGTANQVVGVNAAGSALEYKTLAGTVNQITVTQSAGGIALSTPQSISPSSDVTFNTVTVKQSVSAMQTLTDAALVTVDLNAGASLVLVATAAVGNTRGLSNPTNMLAGTTVTLQFTQDSTGGRDLTFGSAYKFAGGTAPVFGAQPASVSNIIVFWCDGTNMYEVSRSLAIA